MSIASTVLKANSHLLKVNGPLNGQSAQALEQKFWDVHGCGASHVIVDLANVPFIDSRGLAALVKGFKVFGSEKQNFRLAALQDQPKLLLELTMFDKIFQVFDTVEEALGSKSIRPIHRTVVNYTPQPVV